MSVNGCRERGAVLLLILIKGLKPLEFLALPVVAEAILLVSE